MDRPCNELKMYFFERGAGASNLDIRFNLPTVADNSLQIPTELSGAFQTDIYKNRNFEFEVCYAIVAEGETPSCSCCS